MPIYIIAQSRSTIIYQISTILFPNLLKLQKQDGDIRSNLHPVATIFTGCSVFQNSKVGYIRSRIGNIIAKAPIVYQTYAMSDVYRG